MSDDQYIKRPVRSRPGLTESEALESLQEHPQFKAGTKIKDFKRQGSRYTAVLLEPKEAEFPPKKDDEDDEDSGNPLENAVKDELSEDSADGPSGPDDSDDGNDSDDSDSGPPGDSDNGGPPKEDKKKDKPGKELGEIGEVLDLLHKITDALGLNNPDAALTGGPDEGPVPPPGPPAKGLGGPPPGPAGPGAKPPVPRPMKPGMAPPGTTPVGAPAFASVQEMAKVVPSFTATTDENLSIKEAKEDLEETYDPYKVKQIRRKEGKLHALLSVR